MYTCVELNYFAVQQKLGFTGGSAAKSLLAMWEVAHNGGDAGSVLGLGRSPGEGKWQPTPVFLPGKSHGQRSLEGYSPWGRKSWTRLSGYAATTPQQKLTRQCRSTGFCLNYQ